MHSNRNSRFSIPSLFRPSLLILLGFLGNGGTAQDVSLIPAPESVDVRDGAFVLSAQTAILADANTEELGAYLAELIAPATGLTIPVQQLTRPELQEEPCIELYLTPEEESLGEEGYALSVTKDGILLHARTEAGVFYGIQTLRQLLPPEIERPSTEETGVSWDIPFKRIRLARLPPGGSGLDARQSELLSSPRIVTRRPFVG